MIVVRDGAPIFSKNVPRLPGWVEAYPRSVAFRTTFRFPRSVGLECV